MLMVVPGVVCPWPWWSYFRRLQISRKFGPVNQESRQSTESLLRGGRSSYEDPESSQDGLPLATLGEPATTVPDFVRSSLSYGLAVALGCPHSFKRKCSYGNIQWNLDAFNTADARLAYNDLDRGHFDARMDTRLLFLSPVQWLTNLRVLCGDRRYVDGNQLLLARELGIIAMLPKLSTERVSDLSKENIFLKLLAISQIIRLCLQLSMRLSQGISTTQLEVMTMGYALCSTMTYFLLFDRPKDVTTVFEIAAAR